MGLASSTLPDRIHAHGRRSPAHGRRSPAPPRAAELLSEVLDAVDPYTGAHSRAVVELSVAVTKVMGLDTPRRRDVRYAAMLHDVGKVRVPLEIIAKPGRLTQAEWEVMRRHTIEGEWMLQQAGDGLTVVGRFVRSSHERYDGRGYPDGLVGEQIPIESRIVCACDAYNAMTTDRPYGAARRAADALAELRRCAGSQFDPSVVEALEAILERRFEPRPRLAVPVGTSR